MKPGSIYPARKSMSKSVAAQQATPNQIVSFPGAYDDNDPCTYDPSMYSPIPLSGGPVPNLAVPANMTGQLSGNGSSWSLVLIVHGKDR